MPHVASLEDLLKKFIKNPNPFILDVGGNEGQTISIMKSLFVDSRLLSFEPDPSLAKRINEKFPDQGVDVLEIALSDKEEVRVFSKYSDSQANSFYNLEAGGHYDRKGMRLLEKIDVSCKTLDFVVDEKNIEYIDLIKIDTQGHSCEVIKGGEKTFWRNLVGCALVEFNFSGFYERPDDFANCVKFLADAGYSLYSVINGDSHQIGHIYYDFMTGQICSFDAFFVCNNILQREEI